MSKLDGYQAWTRVSDAPDTTITKALWNYGAAGPLRASCPVRRCLDAFGILLHAGRHMAVEWQQTLHLDKMRRREDEELIRMGRFQIGSLSGQLFNDEPHRSFREMPGSHVHRKSTRRSHRDFCKQGRPTSKPLPRTCEGNVSSCQLEPRIQLATACEPLSKLVKYSLVALE